MGRYKVLRWMGLGPVTAAFIASLNYINHGPVTGPVVFIYFMHMTIEVDTRNESAQQARKGEGE
jgi:hypothetical protein